MPKIRLPGLRSRLSHGDAAPRGEVIVKDLGEFGQVLLNREQSYVRSWASGSADDPRLLEMLEAALSVIVAYHLRYVIIDINRMVGQPTLVATERMVEMIPIMVRAGCEAQFSVMAGAPTQILMHASTYQATERERGIQTVQVPNVEAALKQIREANDLLPPDQQR
jgi:hypothetical protein